MQSRRLCEYCRGVIKVKSAAGRLRHIAWCRTKRTIQRTQYFDLGPTTAITSQDEDAGGDYSNEVTGVELSSGQLADSTLGFVNGGSAVNRPGNDIYDDNNFVGISVEQDNTSPSPDATHSSSSSSPLIYPVPSVFSQSSLYSYTDEGFNDSGDGREAGAIFECPPDVVIPSYDETRSLCREVFPTDSQAELARWFAQSRISKQAIDSFLRNPTLRSTFWGDSETIPFLNAAALRRKQESLPCGISHSAWNTVQLDFSSSNEVVAECSPIEPLPLSAEDKRILDGTRLTLFHRDVLAVIRFLLGHPPFRDNLAYVPVKRKSAGGARQYNEFHTGEWWWKTQENLPPQSTVVPLLLASDKTQLTTLGGDKVAWPVYLTIGNLDNETRRSASRPSVVLLGLLPIPDFGVAVPQDSRFRLKSVVYHRAMRTILKPIEELTMNGTLVCCADGLFRRCHPVIAGFMIDYEEQVLLTGVRSGVHCTICKVPSNERGIEHRRYGLRTHQYTQELIERQRSGEYVSQREKVHDVSNFVWNHKLVNVHNAVMVDILHQLLKGVVAHLLEWLLRLLNERLSPTSSRRRYVRRNNAAERRKLRKVVPVHHRLSRRFAQVTRFTGLRIFESFHTIKQWTGKEFKMLSHQLVVAVAPLLIKCGAEPALECTVAIMDFVTMAQSRTHDSETLKYMDKALRRFHAHKSVFLEYRPRLTDSATGGGRGGFNIPKLHSMLHITSFIKQYGSPDGVNTETSERCHVDKVKRAYRLSNKQDGYETQIMADNTRSLNMLALNDLDLYHSTRSPPPLDQELDPPTTKLATGRMDLDRLFGQAYGDAYYAIRRCGLSLVSWRTVEAVRDNLTIPNLYHSIAIFIREQRRATTDHYIADDSIDIKFDDPSWVAEYPMALTASMSCFKRDGKDYNNIENRIVEHVRCGPWRDKTQWRRDWVWVQEYPPDSYPQDQFEGSLGGRQVGQLRLIFEVIDLGATYPRRINGNRHALYRGALVDLMRPLANGRPRQPHGMIEVSRRWNNLPGRRIERRQLSQKAYSLETVIRSAHVVPAYETDEATQDVWLVNNFVDWDHYNTFYDPEPYCSDDEDVPRRGRNLYQ